MLNIKNNQWKNVIVSCLLSTGTMVINFFLTIITWFKIFKMENWLGVSSVVLFFFVISSLFYCSFLLMISHYKILKKYKSKNAQTSQFKTPFLNKNNIAINLIFMLISTYWLIVSFLYFIKFDMIYAVFIIIISFGSLIYISYCLIYIWKIKNVNTPVQNFWAFQNRYHYCQCNKNTNTKK